MFKPFLHADHTRILWPLLEGKPLQAGGEKEREKLREWFEAEVKANAQARGRTDGRVRS